jgi:vacuolar-type H+-ATPase subunit I/STV1
MIRLGPRAIIFTGFLLVFLGFLLPLLMVMKVLESSFPLDFIAAISSILGLFLGIMGTAQYALEIRHKRDE